MQFLLLLLRHPISPRLTQYPHHRLIASDWKIQMKLRKNLMDRQTNWPIDEAFMGVRCWYISLRSMATRPLGKPLHLPSLHYISNCVINRCAQAWWFIDEAFWTNILRSLAHSASSEFNFIYLPNDAKLAQLSMWCLYQISRGIMNSNVCKLEEACPKEAMFWQCEREQNPAEK